ncbi:hypothetical protein MPER_06836, partial [Moniliophthora perniciosa FA553]
MLSSRAFSAFTRRFPVAIHTNRRELATVVADVNDSSFRIPVINFAKFRAATSPDEKKKTADEIVGAFKESGFIYIEGHGIPPETISNAFQKSREFFKMSPEVKDKLAWEDPRSNRGYVKVGRERVTQSKNAAEIAQLRAKAPDYKESMETGRDWDSEWRNMCPQESDAPGFKQTMLGFYQASAKIINLRYS